MVANSLLVQMSRNIFFLTTFSHGLKQCVIKISWVNTGKVSIPPKRSEKKNCSRYLKTMKSYLADRESNEIGRISSITTRYTRVYKAIQ